MAPVGPPVEGGSVLKRGLANADTLHPRAKTGLVHHREHGRDAAILVADEPARGPIEFHHRRG